MAGRITVRSQKIATVPPLPVPMTNGSIEWSEGFEQLPSGTLTYRGVTEQQLVQLQNAYPRGTGVVLGGIPLRVNTFTSKRTNYPINDQIGDRYGFEVTIDLESAWSSAIERNIPVALFQGADGYGNISDLARRAGVGYFGANGRFLATGGRTVTLQSVMNGIARINGGFIRYSDPSGVGIIGLDATNFYQFSQREAVEDSRTVGELPKFYQAEVTGEFVEIESGKPYEPVEGDKPFVPRSVKTYIVEEGIDAVSPPNEAKKIKDLTLNFDVSGEKKVYKRLHYTGNQLTREEEFIYGYSYLAKDILKSRNPQEYEGNPRDFWKIIEYRDTSYVYEPQNVFVNVSFFDPTKTNTTIFGEVYSTVPSLLHPDYRHIFSFSGRTFHNKYNKYLVYKITKGWRLGRFAIETLGDGGEYDRASISLSESPNAKYARQLVSFQTIPLQEITEYTLISERNSYNLTQDSVYGTTEYNLATAPFNVEFMNYYDAEPRIRQWLPVRRNEAGVPIDYRFALIIPKLDFVEPFLIIEQKTIINAFKRTPHPANNPLAPSQPPNRPKLPPLMTGIESYNNIHRTLVGQFMPSFGYYRSTRPVEYDRCGFVRPPKEEYRETITEFNASDPEFANYKEKHETRLVEGRPPNAEVWQQEWERIERCDHKAMLRSPSFVDRTKKYYATSDNADLLDVGSQSFSYPQAQTFEQAKTGVITDLRIQTFQTITRNCRLTWHFPNIRAGDRVRIGTGENAERVLSVSWRLDVLGNNNLEGGVPLVVSQGTNLQLGSDIPRRVDFGTISQNAIVSINYSIQTNVTSLTARKLFAISEINRRNYDSNP